VAHGSLRLLRRFAAARGGGSLVQWILLMQAGAFTANRMRTGYQCAILWLSK
jgi:hypothetical protein